jgi:hypothetical protein
VILAVLVARPLDPSPDEARSLMRRELLKPEYYEDNVIQRLLDWLFRQIDRGIDAAINLPAANTFAAMLIGVLLVGGLVWLVSRAQRTARMPEKKRSVFTDEAITAAQLRARAEAALAAGRTEDAVADGFRALAVRQVERGRLDDTPGTTAQEAARALAGEYPAFGARVGGSAALFDAVIYGDRSATRDQAVAVLELDDELGARR